MIGIGIAAALLFAPQQVSPVAEAGRGCAPKTNAEAVACLDRHLTPAAKARIGKTAAKDMAVERVALGFWIRNNWGLWSNGPLAIFFLQKGVFANETMSDKVIDGYWLKVHGCNLDWNDMGKVTAAINAAALDQPPCPPEA